MADWCDDERNVHVFLNHEPLSDPPPCNIWKEVHEHLRECANNSMYNEIKYTEYIYESLASLSEDDPPTHEDTEEDATTELNEDLEHNSEYAYI